MELLVLTVVCLLREKPQMQQFTLKVKQHISKCCTSKGSLSWGQPCYYKIFLQFTSPVSVGKLDLIMVNESHRSVKFTGWVWLVCTQQGLGGFGIIAHGLDSFGSFVCSMVWTVLAHLYTAGVGQFWLICTQHGLDSFDSFIHSRGWKVLAHLHTAGVGQFWLICTQQGLDSFGSFVHSRGWTVLAHLYTAGVGQFWLICTQQGLDSFGSFVHSRGWTVLAHLYTAGVGQFWLICTQQGLGSFWLICIQQGLGGFYCFVSTVELISIIQWSCCL